MKKQPGKKLDREIEEKIYRRLNKPDNEIDGHSTNISTAFAIKEKIVREGLVSNGAFQAILDKHVLDAKMPAHAIALSCLEAIGEPTQE